MLSSGDIAIVVIYLVIVMVVGMLASRSGGGTGINNYFLGGNKIPWWALAASGMSSNLDVSGTMVIASFIYAIGFSGIWIEIRGGLCLSLAFACTYIGKWARRSKVMTDAEWMRLRFGTGTEGHTARIMNALINIGSGTIQVTYFCIGAGKFGSQMFGFGEDSELGKFYSSAMIVGLGSLYTVVAGLRGVVVTDVFQGFCVFIIIAIVCAKAFTVRLPDQFYLGIPLSDGSVTQRLVSRDDWLKVMPQNQNFAPESDYFVFNRYWLCIILYMLKTCLGSSGGGGGYIAQRFFASGSDQEVHNMTLLWIVLLSFRWPFIAAIVVLAIHDTNPFPGTPMESALEPEEVLPHVVQYILPSPLRGIVVAGLLGAAMSTLDSDVNASASYYVKDIYQAYINPKATEATLVMHSRVATLVIITVGWSTSFAFSSINDIWGFVSVTLQGGLIMPSVLRWFWWRLNGWGYAAGLGAGAFAAVVQKVVAPDMEDYFSFLGSIAASFVAIVAVTFATAPTPTPVLVNFWRTIRPFGYWAAVREQAISEMVQEQAQDSTVGEDGDGCVCPKGKDDINSAINREHRRDILATPVAMVFMTSLFMALMAVVFMDGTAAAVLTTVTVVFASVLYLCWYRHTDGPAERGLMKANNNAGSMAAADSAAAAAVVASNNPVLLHDNRSEPLITSQVI
jgi:Na+/proline symporter